MNQGSILQLIVRESASEFWITVKSHKIVSRQHIYPLTFESHVSNSGFLYRHLQNNQFTGPINVLAGLPLNDL